MTFDAKEQSLEGGDPINLYRFQYGASSFFYYTDAEETISFSGDDYAPIPITHDNIRSNGSLDYATLSINLPMDADVCDLFLTYPPSREVSLIIRAGHASDTEFPVKWTGRVIGCDWSPPEATLSCQPISTALLRPGIRRRYSVPCPYALYDQNTCKANEAAATVATTVSSVSGAVIGLPTNWHGSFSAAKFNGGKAKWTNSDNGLPEVRRILSADANSMRVAGLVRGLSATDAINVVLGCNRQESGFDDPNTDCDNLHNNLANHGGMPFLPKDNPVEENKFY